MAYLKYFKTIEDYELNKDGIKSPSVSVIEENDSVIYKSEINIEYELSASTVSIDKCDTSATILVYGRKNTITNNSTNYGNWVLLTNNTDYILSYDKEIGTNETSEIITYNVTINGLLNYSGLTITTSVIQSAGPCTVIEQYVDLGLSVQWATCNVGATRPEECGYFFQWGETQGYEVIPNGDSFTTIPSGKIFDASDYKYVTGETITKYNEKDKKATLDLSDDAAYAANNNMRTPTSAELQELLDGTTQTFTTNYNNTNVSGYVFTSKSDSTKSIFFPTKGTVGSNIAFINEACAIMSSELYGSDSGSTRYINCMILGEIFGNQIAMADRFGGVNVRGVLIG